MGSRDSHHFRCRDWLRCHGLEFARARLAQEHGSFSLYAADRVWSGSGGKVAVRRKQRTLKRCCEALGSPPC